jgi:hypothetical protein
VHGEAGDLDCVRDTTAAARGLRWLARRLAVRGARPLQVLRRCPTYRCPGTVTGWSAVAAGRTDAAGRRGARTREALRLLRALHARGIVHNDLAKEPNWLVTPEGLPALVDFQLAMYSPRRGRLFMALAHDDLRHLLKHKRSYARALSVRTRCSRAVHRWPGGPIPASPLYRLTTRRLLGWADR